MSSTTGSVARVFRVMRSKPLGALGGLLILVLVATALLAPVLAPHDPIKMKSTDRLQAPSLNHPLGTDDFGRDILSRVIYGARISMLLGLGAVAISTILAAIIGIVSGYYGGRIDTILQRCIDTLMAFPGFVVLLTIMAMLGQGLGSVILALGIGGTAGNARIIRSAVLAIRANQYLEVARATGCRDWRIIARHILPNIAAPIMVVVTLGLGVAILAESSLSFLGFGVPPPTPSWGAMLSGSGRTYMIQAPWTDARGAAGGRVVHGHRQPPGGSRCPARRVKTKDPVARRTASAATEQVDDAVQHHRRGVVDPLRKVSDDGCSPGSAVVRLDPVRVPPGGELPAEGIDPAAERRRRRVPNRRRKPGRRREAPPVGRAKHRRGRALAVITAEYVGRPARADRGEVGKPCRKTTHPASRAAR